MTAIATARSGALEARVDLLDEPRLTLILTALDRALAAHPERIWPNVAKNPLDDPVPVLVPLDRMGAAQGYSGASVFVAYFIDERPGGGGRHRPSRPLVVKIGDHRRLEREKKAADLWPPDPEGQDARFARPFFLSDPDANKEAVLIAPFSSSTQFAASLRRLTIVDLYTDLTAADGGRGVEDQIARVRDLYDLIHGIHARGLDVCDRVQIDFERHYRLSLRELSSTHEVTRGLFGDGPTSEAYGRTWANPNRVLEAINALPAVEGTWGSVHGDLHPKNVVFDKYNRSHVIDFGWASDKGHIVRDYVLMEINLRAMTLSSQVSVEELIAFGAQLSLADPAVGSSSEDIQRRARILREALWAKAVDNRIVEDWDREYLVPMFLVAYGLIKYLDTARNQTALLITILSLADRLAPQLGLPAT
jgi:hypothetical protein